MLTLATMVALAGSCGETKQTSDPALPGNTGGSEARGGETAVGGGTGTGAGTSPGGAGSGGGGSSAGGSGGAELTYHPPTFTNYQLTGHWPALEAAITPMPGALSYETIQITDLFLAESCSIADYNDDGHPDVSAGRRWYEGPEFTTEHIFRDGHEELPATGAQVELDTGASDDWADFPWDINGDGFADIIDIANSSGNTALNPNPAPVPQPMATSYWYENPGGGWADDPPWTPHLLHGDVSHEQRGIVDVDGDGRPEIFAACKDCIPEQTKGYYSGNWDNPAEVWTYTAVTEQIAFPYDGTGRMHGLGFGDVDGDGHPDMLDRIGVWIQDPQGGPWELLSFKLYDGVEEESHGGAHMYAWDIDGDGDQDIFSADDAHGSGLAWYEQTPEGPQPFIKHYFMGPEDNGLFDVYFTQPHAAQVIDMDGDGVSDIVTGKMRYALGPGDPDTEGSPVVYVFKTVRDEPGVSGQAHFEPHLVTDVSGVGRQIAVGHANLDGIMDICAATKVGIYVFLGQ